VGELLPAPSILPPTKKQIFLLVVEVSSSFNPDLRSDGEFFEVGTLSICIQISNILELALQSESQIFARFATHQHQHINTSTHQHINTSTHQHHHIFNTSTHRHTSTQLTNQHIAHEHVNTPTLRHINHRNVFYHQTPAHQQRSNATQVNTGID
jgi:hypothetical protein